MILQNCNSITIKKKSNYLDCASCNCCLEEVKYKIYKNEEDEEFDQEAIFSVILPAQTPNIVDNSEEQFIEPTKEVNFGDDDLKDVQVITDEIEDDSKPNIELV